MLLDVVTKDTTDYSCVIRIVDSTDGTPETGVAFNTAGIDLWYRRPQAAHSSITEATQTEGGAHTDGGFVHISDGYYRLDLPDAAVATGVDYVDIGGTVTDMVVIGGRIRLTDVDLQDATRGGMTALPNAAADAAGGLAISDAGGLDLDTVLSGNTPQTGDSFARLGAPAGASVSADIATVDSNVDAVLVDTSTTLQNAIDTIDGIVDQILVDTAEIGTAGAGLTDLGGMSTGMQGEVNAEMVDVMETDTVPVVSQGAPPLNPTKEQILAYLYTELRNKVVVDTNTANQKQVFADNGTDILYEKDLTNASNVTTVDKATTGA